jgi:hypothetical protein
LGSTGDNEWNGRRRNRSKALDQRNRFSAGGTAAGVTGTDFCQRNNGTCHRNQFYGDGETVGATGTAFPLAEQILRRGNDGTCCRNNFGFTGAPARSRGRRVPLGERTGWTPERPRRDRDRRVRERNGISGDATTGGVSGTPSSALQASLTIRGKTKAGACAPAFQYPSVFLPVDQSSPTPTSCGRSRCSGCSSSAVRASHLSIRTLTVDKYVYTTGVT